VKQTPGSIGYVELIFAIQNKIAYGSVQNMPARVVKASVQSVTAAAGAASKQMPADFASRSPMRPAPGVLSDLVVHVAVALLKRQGQGDGEVDGRVPEVGAQRRPEVRARISDTRRCRQDGDQAGARGAGESQDVVVGR
jgi:hypothetical protein